MKRYKDSYEKKEIYQSPMITFDKRLSISKQQKQIIINTVSEYFHNYGLNYKISITSDKQSPKKTVGRGTITTLAHADVGVIYLNEDVLQSQGFEQNGTKLMNIIRHELGHTIPRILGNTTFILSNGDKIIGTHGFNLAVQPRGTQKTVSFTMFNEAFAEYMAANNAKKYNQPYSVSDPRYFVRSNIMMAFIDKPEDLLPFYKTSDIYGLVGLFGPKGGCEANNQDVEFLMGVFNEAGRLALQGQSQGLSYINNIINQAIKKVKSYM